MMAFAWFALGYVTGMFATVFLFVIVLPVLREGRGRDVEST